MLLIRTGTIEWSKNIPSMYADYAFVYLLLLGLHVFTKKISF